MSLQNIIEVVGGVSSLGFAGSAVYGVKKVASFLKQKHISELAKAAVLYAEDAFPNVKGSGKLKGACSWFSNELQSMGIKKFSETRIESLVRSAYQKVKIDAQQAIGSTVVNNHIESPVQPVASTDDSSDKSVENPKEVDQAPDETPVPAPEPVKEVVKQVTEMTSEDLKQLVGQVVDSKLASVQQVQTPVTAAAPVQAQ